MTETGLYQWLPSRAMDLYEVILRGGKPWGFTLEGGSEVGQPLTISQVNC